MKKIIEDIRQKPPHVRRMFAFGTSLGVTGIIAIVWFTSLIAQGLAPSPVVKDQVVSQGPSPFSVMKDQFSDIVKMAGNQMANISTAFSFMQSSTTDSGIYDKKSGISSSTIKIDDNSSIGVSTTSVDQEPTTTLDNSN